MSSPTYDIKCNKCDYGCSSRITWGHYIYTDGESTFTCNKCMGWCQNCAGITPMEDFEETGERETAEILRNAQWIRESNGTFWQALLGLLFAGRRSAIVGNVNSIISASKTLALAKKRKGTQCCLECGSQKVTPIRHNAALNLPYNSTYTGADLIDFKHPGCGGDFIAVGSNMRFSVKRKTRTYTTSGHFIEETLE